MSSGAALAAVLLAAAPQPRQGISLEVVSRLGAIDEQVKERVLDRVSTVADELGQPVLEHANRRLYIVVEWRKEGTDFGVKFATATDGRELEKAGQFDCVECTASQLLDHIDAESRLVIERFSAPDPEPLVNRSLRQTSPTHLPPVLRDAPARRGRTKSWQAGTASVVAGSAATVSGIALAAVGERRIRDRPTMLRNYRPAGITLLAAGALLLATAAVLFVLDHRRRSSQTTARGHGKRSSVSPTIPSVSRAR